MLRTEQESERRGRKEADLLVLPRPAESLQNGIGFSKIFDKLCLSKSKG